MTVLTVRREGPGDVGSIRDVHRAAFGGGEPVEAGLVDALRADAAWLPHLALLGAAQARDETIVGLLGEPGYYGRFGFVAATDVGITPPDPGWGRYFQVLVAGGRSSTGTFRYAAPFDDLV